MKPIISTDEIRVEDYVLAAGVRLRITNIPTIVRTGGHEPGVRLYYTRTTAKQLERLRELGRVRMLQGDTDIVLDFGDDATIGRRSLQARYRDARERGRKFYDQRMRAVPRFGSSDYYHERLHPANPRTRGEVPKPALAGGENVAG
ncbi:MAG: hypothetical protein QOD51_2985 [Candidatus Eremiobacteraeota bacterium]|nr:hypothetical protein [Candidatus Eremiobacteraeota bacterium]